MNPVIPFLQGLVSDQRRIAQLLIIVTGAVYWPVQDFGFHNVDDPFYLTHNPLISQGWSWEGVRWAFSAPFSGSWMPMLWLSLMTDAELFSGYPGGTHLVNLLFHLGNVLLFLFLWQRMTGNLWKSAFAATLFALHPQHVEGVVWLVERKEVLSSFFGLLALWTYLRFVATIRGEKTFVNTGTLTAYTGTWLLFAMSLAVKPAWVVFPFLLLLLDGWPLGRFPLGFTRLLVEKLPFLALSLLFSILSLQAHSDMRAIISIEEISLGQRLADMPVIYATYLQKSFFPLELAPFYPYPDPRPGMAVVLGALFLITAITGAAIWWVRRSPFLLVGWLWFLGALFPFSGLLVAGSGQFIADRFNYLPHMGLFVAVSWGAGALLPNNSLRPAIVWISALTLIVASAVLTRNQVNLWRHDETLWRHTLAVTQRNHRAHYLLGKIYRGQGRFYAALAEMKKAALIQPNPRYWQIIGDTLFQMGRLDPAMAAYHQGLRLDPGSSQLPAKIGMVLLGQKRFPEAMLFLQKAIERQEKGFDRLYYENFHNMGIAMAAVGALEKAALFMDKALREEPPKQRRRCQEAADLFGGTEARRREFPGAARMAAHLCSRYPP